MRHRTMILFLALIHIGMGLTILLGPHSPRVPDYAILFELLPFWAREVAWFFFAAVAIALSYTRYDKISWVLLSVMPAQRVVGHAWSALMWIVPGAPGGLASSVGNLVVWTSLLLLIWYMAGAPNLNAERRRVAA